jgi:HK97 family phage major capsid protein
MSVKALREERASIIKNARAKHDEALKAGREMTGEELQAWDAQMADAAKLQEQIDRLVKLEAMEASLAEKAERSADLQASHVRQPVERSDQPTSEDKDRAFAAWCMNSSGKFVPEDLQESANKCGVNLNAKEFKFNLSNRSFQQIKNASGQNVTTAADGGYLVPEGFVNNLEVAMLHYGGILGVADVIRTSSGNDLPWPTLNDTSNTGALLAEDAEVTKLDAAFGQTVYNAYKYTSRLMLVSQELMEDSAFNIPNVIGQIAGERLGRVLNTACTTADGSSKPAGIVTGAAAGVTAAATAAITTDEIKNLKRSVDIAYRPNAKWMMNDATAGYLLKLQDGQSNYIWEENYRSADPTRLLGHEVVINNDMADIGTSAVPIIFGDFSKHKIRMVNDVRLYRMQERYREFDQDGFVAFMRFDSGVLDAGGNPIKKMTMASS